MKYTAYWTATGRIAHSGLNSDPQITKRDGQGIIEGIALGEGWRIDLETLQPVAIDPDFDLAGELHMIDRQAESIRGLFITNTASQPAIYLEKEKEALAVVANLDIAQAETPNLTLEAARTGETRFDVAVAILTQAYQWRQISALIEDRRLSAKDQARTTMTRVSIDWSDIEVMAPAS